MMNKLDWKDKRNLTMLADYYEFDTLPITPEVIWKGKTGGNYDTV